MHAPSPNIAKATCLLALCVCAAARMLPISELRTVQGGKYVQLDKHHGVDGGSGRVVSLGEGDELQFIPADDPVPEGAQVVAQATFVDSLVTKSNFGKLRVEANSEDVDALLRYRAAGFAEGYLTACAIYDHFRNTRDYFKTNLYPEVDVWDAPMGWLKEQDAWLREELQARAHSSKGSSSSSSGGSTSQGTVRDDDDDDAPHPLLWQSVGMQVAQFEGIIEGYAARRNDVIAAMGGLSEEDTEGGQGKRVRVPGPMSREDHMFLQNNGELYDIVDGYMAGAWGHRNADQAHAKDSPRHSAAAQSSQAASTTPRSPGNWLQDIALRGHCSGLIKVAADLSDIYVGHATWDSFTQALRIYKHYDFGGPGFGRLSYSSYPGETFSDDDFYLSESGLVVTETTNHIFDPAVFANLSPRTLLSWQRVRTALLLANSGEEWVNIFKYKNSGTYNNQYMVVDTKRFEPLQRLAPGLLWVAEQLPGMIEAGDVTDVLSRGHWGSYNVPSFEKIYNASGYPQALEAMTRDQMRTTDATVRARFDISKRWMLYQSAPRANIYRRDHASVDVNLLQNSEDGAVSTVGGHHQAGLDGMEALMRLNNYKQDKFQFGHPSIGVCSRGDLSPESAASWGPDANELRSARGCFDGKVTNTRLAARLESEVVNGPTTSHGIPPFSWAEWNRGTDFTIYGHPEVFDYDWERMRAEDLPLPEDLQKQASAAAAA